MNQANPNQGAHPAAAAARASGHHRRRPRRRRHCWWRRPCRLTRRARWRRTFRRRRSSVARPTGFADIVEKVKPAVISVRVKMRADAQLSRPTTRCRSPRARRWSSSSSASACPTAAERRNAPRGRQFGQAQGSGFFISADGYAVTNNHVVEKATTVEISTDDGKTHTAKVIGTDPRTDLALIKVEGGTTSPTSSLRTRRRASAIGCSRSAIRSASAAP